jgi:hypothetical protein
MFKNTAFKKRDKKTKFFIVGKKVRAEKGAERTSDKGTRIKGEKPRSDEKG